MKRTELVSFRETPDHYEILRGLADRQERTISDYLRVLWRREARALGLLPELPEQPCDTSQGKAGE